MMKIPAAAAFVVFSLGASLQAAENAYDVLGKTLAPFANLFAREGKNPNRAMTADLKITDAVKLHPALVGQSVHLAMQSPDKIFLRAPVLGQDVIVCRNGQDIWAAPGAQIDAILRESVLPKPVKKYKLGDFSLPIPAQQLALLPVLFQVADEGEQPVGAQNCRVLFFKLMPELARALDVEDWTARVWVRADYKPAKLQIVSPQASVTFAFEKLEFAPSLPAETWKPGPEQTDVTHLPPGRYKQLFDAVTKSIGAHR